MMYRLRISMSDQNSEFESNEAYSTQQEALHDAAVYAPAGSVITVEPVKFKYFIRVRDERGVVVRREEVQNSEFESAMKDAVLQFGAYVGYTITATLEIM